MSGYEPSGALGLALIPSAVSLSGLEVAEAIRPILTSGDGRMLSHRLPRHGSWRKARRGFTDTGSSAAEARKDGQPAATWLIRVAPVISFACLAATYVFDPHWAAGYGLRTAAFVAVVATVSIALASGVYEGLALVCRLRRCSTWVRCWLHKPDWEEFDRVRRCWERSSGGSRPSST